MAIPSRLSRRLVLLFTAALAAQLSSATTAAADPMPANSSQTITLVAMVDCAVMNGVAILNNVSVSADTPDYDSTNNNASATITATDSGGGSSSTLVQVAVPKSQK